MYYILKEGRIIKCFAGYRQETGPDRGVRVICRERVTKRMLVVGLNQQFLNYWLEFVVFVNF